MKRLLLVGLTLCAVACTEAAPPTTVAPPLTSIPSTTAATAPRLQQFEPLDVEVGGPTAAVAAFDVDRDRDVDLAVATGNEVLVLVGDGTGMFTPTARVAAGENAADLAVGDVDGDGRSDVVVANHDTGYLTVLFGSDGGFEQRAGSRITLDVSPHPHAVLLEDVDGDGHLDVLVDDRDEEAVRVLSGGGDGTFAARSRIRVGGDPYLGMWLGGVDGDGSLDLLSPNPDGVALVAALGDGAIVTLDPGFDPFSVVGADVNGDGVLDVAAGSGERLGRLVVWLGLGGGQFPAEPLVFEIAVGPTWIDAADLDGDGADEVIVSSYIGNEVAVLTGGAEPRLIRTAVADSPWVLTVGDFDGDGFGDIGVARDTGTALTLLLARPGT